MADPAVEELDALLSLVTEDWKIRCLEAEHDLKVANESNVLLTILIDDLRAQVAKLELGLKESRDRNRWSYEGIARDEEKTKSWYHDIYSLGHVSRKDFFRDSGS